MQMSKSVLWQDKQASKQTTKKTKTEFKKQAFLRTSNIPDLVQCLKKLKHLSYFPVACNGTETYCVLRHNVMYWMLVVKALLFVI